MDFVFICPQTQEVFTSSDFHIQDNKGVIVDPAGNKVLDATVVLDAPCPFCGKKHVYAASELSCPFGS